MWQQFCLVAPRARKYRHFRANLEQILFERDSIEKLEDLVYLLAVPLKSHQRTISSSVYTSQYTNMNNSPIGIFRLPREIHLKIFAELADARDWEKIVCVGDLVKANDYPPGLFSDAEILSFDQPEIRRALDLGSFFSNDEPKPVTLYDFSVFVMGCHQRLGTIWKGTEETELLIRCINSFADHSLVFNGPPKHDFKNFKEHCFYPRDQPWVLRNLTTKEFASHTVILSRICWSSVPNADIGGSTEITRGVWAGHCFDITQLSKHIEMTQGETWIDVSSEVMDDISRIWERKYGPDWQERIIENIER
ncbi:hypothetical protein F4815DRAFT_498394 [Daldinia loculata]|nr:hypothetical protein F4815DRAFT_498394 [Daldinia loculata]